MPIGSQSGPSLLKGPEELAKRSDAMRRTHSLLVRSTIESPGARVLRHHNCSSAPGVEGHKKDAKGQKERLLQ